MLKTQMSRFKKLFRTTLTSVLFSTAVLVLSVSSSVMATKFVIIEVSLPFVDTQDHWSKIYVADLYQKGVVNGYDETHYGPDNPITRAEFTKIALNIFGFPVFNADEIQTNPFKDVKSTDWFYPYVKVAHASGVINGYPGGFFKPNNPVTRAEAVKVLVEAGGLNPNTGYNAGFKDVDGSAWYAPYVNYAAEQGMVNGYPDGTYGVNKSLTRGEVAKIVSILLAKEIEQ